ncbi:hypothetical protein D3C80_2221220 [compost metagenome]
MLAGTVVDHAVVGLDPEVRRNHLAVQLQGTQHYLVGNLLLGQAGHHQAAQAIGCGLGRVQIIKKVF